VNTVVRSSVWIVLSLSTTMVAACDKKPPPSGETATGTGVPLTVTPSSGTAAATAGATAAGGGCAAGETENAKPRFCYRVPAGYRLNEEQSTKEDPIGLDYTNGKQHLWIRTASAGNYKGSLDAIRDGAKRVGRTDLKEEDIAGGKGKLITAISIMKSGSTETRILHIESALAAKTFMASCQTQYAESTPMTELLDACKSLHEP
jgi:hypothetical protein